MVAKHKIIERPHKLWKIFHFKGPGRDEVLDSATELDTAPYSKTPPPKTFKYTDIIGNNREREC